MLAITAAVLRVACSSTSVRFSSSADQTYLSSRRTWLFWLHLFFAAQESDFSFLG